MFQSGSRYRTATEPKLEGSVRFGSDDNFKINVFDSGTITYENFEKSLVISEYLFSLASDNSQNIVFHFNNE